jgi:cell division protein FtsA
MARHIAVGIDIGTYQVKVVVTSAQSAAERLAPKIIGTGSAESRGLRHGYIINQAEAVKSIHSALRQAEKTAGIKISRAFLSIGGIGLGSTVSTGSLVISRADSEITDLDIKKVQEVAEQEIPQPLSLNRRVLHAIPVQYRIDGKTVLGRPHGMKGIRLEAVMLFITSLSHHLDDLIEAVQECGVEVEDVMAAPLAASFVTLSKTQRIAGCVLANIGAETVSIAVFENDIIISLEVFPIGSSDITNDIALGLKIPLEQAEKMKVSLPSQGTSAKIQNHPRKKLEEIIGARLSDIFELIEAHLKKIGRNGLLPAGIIITGGGSGISTIEDLAKGALKLPSKKLDMRFEGSKGPVRDSSWAVAYGLCIVAFTTDESKALGINPHLRHMVKSTKNNIWAWIKQFLP